MSSKERFLNFSDLLASDPEPDLFGRLRAAERFGRPLADDGFLAAIKRLTGHLHAAIVVEMDL